MDTKAPYTIFAGKYLHSMGMCDSAGKVIIEPIYFSLYFCENNLILASDETGMNGFLNLKGEVVIPFIYNNAEPFINGVATVKTNQLYGVIDAQNRFLIKPLYDRIYQSGDYFAVQKNGFCWYIDKNGVLVPEKGIEQIVFK